MQIFLIRHGATAGNLERRYVGVTDEELTEDAVRILTEDGDRYPVPDCVFASPLKRCVETAKLLFPGQTVRLLPDLAECAFGEFEYKNYQELRGDPRYQAWIDSGGTLPFPGGESREEFQNRCCQAFLDGCRQAEEDGCSRAAFVVHGGTIMAVLDRFSHPHEEYFHWQTANGAGYAGVLEDGIRITELRPLPGPPQTGIESHYVMKQQKKLLCGYTTGTCAAAAAKGAATMLLTGRRCGRVSLMTPKGIRLRLSLEECDLQPDSASCAVRKYAGDDPDATDGMLIFAAAERISEKKIVIDGGRGIGRVTRPGLEQPPGAAAINRVPREMITREVEEICEANEYPGGLRITISAPEGEAVARRTFNPQLGIEGGISILGTNGIVMPMSEEALIASIRVEMRQKAAEGESYLLITPGNYGADFIRKKELSPRLDAEHSMKCSNYVGETLDMAAELGIRGILFVAHIGKFIKVSGGIMNTHSACADCRAELMAAQAMRAGASTETVRRLLASNTTEEAVEILKAEGVLEKTMEETAGRIRFHLQKRCRGAFQTEAILFSNVHGYLGETEGAEELMERIIVQGGAHEKLL